MTSNLSIAAPGPPPGREPSSSLRIATWNISHWSRPKVERAAFEIPFDILAVQETHLAIVPLERAHTTAASLDLHLHHGRPVPPSGHSLHGRSCGVGFLARRGLALSKVLPTTAAGRRLHAHGRWHAVRLAPRSDLPHGLLLVTIYAPLESQRHGMEREQWQELMQEHLHALDMQIPTLLLGDFNGALFPERDFSSSSGSRRAVCPLLAHLLGPGGAWLDVHATLLDAPLPWTFQLQDTSGKLSASRIDLVLANRAAMPLVTSAAVHSAVRDGGHSPVLVTLTLRSPSTICWQRPRPRVPPLLQLPSIELRGASWDNLLDKWRNSQQARAALGNTPAHTLDSLSRAMLAALHHLVALAGGWVTRPARRRLAYDSNAIRQARQELAALHRLESMVRRQPTAQPGSWPYPLTQQISALQHLGIPLPTSSLPSLLTAITSESATRQAHLRKMQREMQHTRHLRWRDALPVNWRHHPGVVYRYLEGARPLWGEAPIIDNAGLQCTSPAAVDAAVRAYWVDEVLRKDASLDPIACWNSFLASPFGSFIPTASWPCLPWTGDRVRRVLQQMRESAAPGLLGIPIAVWRSLPDEWMSAVANLLTLVEAEGRWPREWLDAYVTMIPKAAGGTRPRDQRPITVLDIVYRVWAKGIVLEWSATLNDNLLGPAAMGFRRELGTLHLAQLLNDLILLRRRRREQLWLASFDIQKCFDSLPWWALFGVLRRAGARETVVCCFEAFYRDLQRRFRYGQLDGATWHATNGLAQGCPASPDLLNLLFEPFHRWAAAQNFGIDTPAIRVSSASFADDVVLLAGSRDHIIRLISAYLEWCSLLHVTVTKVQLWSSLGAGQHLTVGSQKLISQSTFKVVGVVLGLREKAATALHVSKRLDTALATARRLRTLPLPAAICSLLWRTTVLPQALYGCEIRNVLPSQLTSLVAAGKALVAHKAPLDLNSWRSPAALHGPPLGDTALREPTFEMRERQLRWLQLLNNSPSLVGTVHRTLAWSGSRYLPPNQSLSAALHSLGWTVRRNVTCLRSTQWPLLDAEAPYPGSVELTPQDTFENFDAVFTDGSLTKHGGAAAVCPNDNTTLLAHIPDARSSTHCELVALCLALSFSPSQILTDSLVSLQLIRRWSTRSVAQTLSCPDRSEVRHFIHLARQLLQPPLLEKVKAHAATAIDAGHPKALGNDAADRAAKQATSPSSSPPWVSAAGLFDDPVELLDASGMPVLDVRDRLLLDWWAAKRRSFTGWKAQLYTATAPIDWPTSSGIFRRPVVSGTQFSHPAPRAVVKWIARIRCGCLATRERLHRHYLNDREQAVSSSTCPCCLSAIETDEHMLAGCPATGTVDCLALMHSAWRDASSTASPPPDDWLLVHRFQLLAALIPQSLHAHLTSTSNDASRIASRFHLALAVAVAERLRRRFAIAATAASTDAQEPPLRAATGVSLACPLPLERQLSPQALRQLELQRRDQQPPATSSSATDAPPSGEPRQRWLRARLLDVLSSETEPCPTSKGSTAVVFLELFERVTQEPFTDTPGIALTNRIRSIAKVLGNITRDNQLQPPLLQSTSGSLVRWNRAPRHRTDVRAWRHNVEQRERHSAPAPRQHTTMRQVDAGLADWIRHHRFLRPADPTVGESGMALLLLWEVDHQQPFPTGGRNTRTDTLIGFTRRLKRRIKEDPQLTGWLQSTDLHQPLAPGMYPSHHLRWGVTISAPAPDDPSRGWYDDFTTRWRAFLAEQALGIHVPATRSAGPSSQPAAAASSSSAQLDSAPAPHIPATGARPKRLRASTPAHTSPTRAAASSASKSSRRTTAQLASATASRQPVTRTSRKRHRAPSPPRPPPIRPPTLEASSSSRNRSRTPSPSRLEHPTPHRRQGDLHRWIAVSPEDDSLPRQRRRLGSPRISPPSGDASDQRLPRRPHTAPENGTDQAPRRQHRLHDLRSWIVRPAPATAAHRAPGHSRAEQGPPT